MFAYCANNPVLFSDWSGTKVYTSPWEDQTDSNTGSVYNMILWLISQSLYCQPSSSTPLKTGEGKCNGIKYKYTAYASSNYNSNAIRTAVNVKLNSFYMTDITDYIKGMNSSGFYVCDKRVGLGRDSDHGKFTVDYGNGIVILYEIKLEPYDYHANSGGLIEEFCEEAEGLLNLCDTWGSVGYFACPTGTSCIMCPQIK